MRDIILFIGAFVFLLSCSNRNNENLEYVVEKFYEYADQIQSVEYDMHKIDSIPDDQEVWDNKGYSYIERNIEDTIFGISFYGKRYDVNKEHIYRNSIGYEFFNATKRYKIEKSASGFLGKPGGQMVALDVFKLDSNYKDLLLSQDNDSYTLTFKYEDDTLYDITQRIKKVSLRKNDFFPISIYSSSNILGSKSSTLMTFSNIKTYKNKGNTIDSLLNVKKSIYTEIVKQNRNHNSLVGSVFDLESLPSLFDGQSVIIDTKYPVLIDFWEFWCGPCVASLPKVEKLHKTFSKDIRVIGIVSQNKDKALRLIEKNAITFDQLLGTESILRKFGINSFPRYLLIDQKGIVFKEYFGFTESMERDIKELIEID